MRIIFIALHFILFIPTTYAASIKQDIDIGGQPTILIEGEIVKGDFTKFEQVSAKLILKSRTPLVVAIDSKGGDVVEAIKIGRLIRKLLASTYVWGNNIINSSSELANDILKKQSDPDRAKSWSNWRVISSNNNLKETDITKCYSSCVFILLAGIEKNITDNHDDREQRIEIPVIGIHRIYFDQKYFSKLTPEKALVEYKNAERLVGDYLKELGVSDLLMDRMLKSSSDSIEFVSAEKFKVYFNKTEPYYEEYMLAKCGSNDPNKFLNTEDQADFNAINKQLMKEYVQREQEKPSNHNEDVFTAFIPDGYDKDHVIGLRKHVQMRINEVQQCHKDTLISNQLNWADSITLKK